MADNSTKIVITAEDKTQAALNSVRNSLNGMSTLAASFGASFAGLASAGGIAAFAKSAIDSMAAFDDMAEKTGATVESLSALSDIARIGGHDLGNVELGMIRLAKALAGGDDEAKAAGHALETLGLKAADLRAMDTGTAMLTLSKALDQFGDSGGKSALAMDLLGKSGAQLLPFLKDLAEKGELNAKVTTEQAAQAERLQKAWNQLKVASDDLGRSVATGVMPALERLAQAFSGGVIEGAVSRWGAAFKGFAAGLTETLAAGEEFLGKITFGKVAENHYKLALQYRDRAKAIYAELSALAPVGAAPAAAKGSLANYTSVSKDGKVAKAGKADRPFDPEGDFFAAVDEAQFQAQKKAATEAGEAVIKYDEALKKSAESLYKATDVGTFDAMLDSLSKAEEAFNRGFIDQDQLDAISDHLLDVNEKLKQTKSIGEELGMTFTSAFEDAIVGGKKFSEVLNSLAQDVLRLVMRKNITEPLANSISKFDWSKLLPSAAGNVFSGPGIAAFSGQVVSRPTVFPFASGVGLMGEAGPEAILPLTRRNGKLGVEGGGSNMVVNIIEQPGSGGKTAQRNEGGVNILDVFVERIKAAVAQDISDGRGAIPSALSNSYGLNRAAGAY